MTPSLPTLRILAIVRLRARRLGLWMEHLWQAEQTSPDQGPAIGAAEVTRLLAPEADRAAEAAFIHKRAGYLPEEIEAAATDLENDPAWSALRQRLDLTSEEADFLTLLIAVEIDPGLNRVVAYLHDDGRLTQPTPWLSARLSGREPAPFAGPNLQRWLLAAPLDEPRPPRLTTPWQIDPAVVQAVFVGQWRDADKPDDVRSWPHPHPAAWEIVSDVHDLRDAELVGQDGIGRQTLAAQLAAARGRALLTVDLQPVGASPLPTLIRALRAARMTNAIVYVRHADAASDADWARLREFGVPFLRGVRHPTGTARPIVLGPLTIAARRELWRHMTTAPIPDSLITQRLSPAEIRQAAADPSTPLRRRTRADHHLLTPLPTPYDWDDLVLPADVTDQLRAFETQIRLRWSVYEDWGFGRLTPLGGGISALFGGPSGTGKTMAAQVVAHSLGLDLVRVDLAGVVNKYIGETEKKLREVFDACEDSGALLFFDEADALFGQRTQVKDAHDRFANIEIDYLLQRIEQFEGVAILATNRRQDLDTAFVRRLRFVIEFLPPRPEQRLALWHRALPEAAPNGEVIREAIDWGYLAGQLAMNGAEIKATALGAAFLARAEGSRIAMRHVLIAAQREMAKQGLRLRLPLLEAAE